MDKLAGIAMVIIHTIINPVFWAGISLIATGLHMMGVV